MALQDMRRFAEKWRVIAEQRKKGGPLPKAVPAKQQTAQSASASETKKERVSVKKAAAKPVKKDDHNQFRTVLPQDVNEQHCVDKHLALVHEAKNLDLAELTYSGLALIRMLFESSVLTYMERHKKFDEIKQFAIDLRRKKMPNVSAEHEKKLVPNAEEMLQFLINNPEIWGAAKRNFLRHSAADMKKDHPLLNSAVHNPYQILGTPKAFEIRDAVLALLRHLIEA